MSAHYIDKKEMGWLMKSTTETSKKPERDLCLIAMFVGTPCYMLDLNRVQIGDVLTRGGKLIKSFKIRGDAGFNGEPREVYVSSPELRKRLNTYLDWRVENGVGLGDHPDYYRGLDSDLPLFDFAITFKQVGKKRTYAAGSLGRHIKNLLRDGGIEEPSVLSGRRTFAITLHLKGFDIAHINHLLGNKTLETTKKLLIANPIDMGAIAANAF